MRITTKTAITPIALSISLIHAAPISTTGNADDAKDVQVGFLEYFTNAMTGLMTGTEKEGEGEETPGDYWKHYGKQQKKYWKKVGKQYKKKYTPPADSDDENVAEIVLDAENLI